MGMMWEQDCGVLPVVDSERRVVGMVTDRDLATAMATRNRLASEITVQDVLNGPPCCCSPDDGIKHALMTMASHKIRRLPVVTTDGSLRGIFSINDAISQASPRSASLSYNDVMDTLKSVCEHRTVEGA
jgi:CBS domain-containing protein